MSTYYVDSNAADDLGNGAIGTPFKTIAHAVSHMASGDTLYFRSGTWNEALDLGGKAYASLTIFARYPSDAAGSAILDGNGLNLDPYEEGVVWIHSTSSNIRVDGLKVINASHTGIAVLSSSNIDVRNCISDTSLHAGIQTWGVSDSVIYGNTIYNSNMPAGSEEILSIDTSSNIEVSYNTLYAGNRTLGQSGGEGLNIKNGCSYIYVHHNTVDMARPDEADSDRYSMGVDGWTAETHHIYFYDNIIKNGAWGLQFSSEEGGYTHHLYGWNNVISHIGYSTNQHGGGIGMPNYGNSPGKLDYCYFWNNTIYDCYYGANFLHVNIGAPIQVKNNIFYGCVSTVIAYGGSVNQEYFTVSNNLLDTGDPHFLNEGTLDFHLTAASTNCIDQGTALSGPLDPGVTVDYDSVARGATFDIGAYEYESGETEVVSIYVGEE